MQPARAGLAWTQPNFKVLHKVSACVDDRHFEILVEFGHALKGHSPAIKSRLNDHSIPRAGTKAKW